MISELGHAEAHPKLVSFATDHVGTSEKSLYLWLGISQGPSLEDFLLAALCPITEVTLPC